MTHENPPFIGEAEVEALLATVDDKRIRRYIEFGMAQAVMRCALARRPPSAPFDLKFFAEVLRTMFEQRQVLESILIGDPDEFRWWPEDDD